ncbi:S8 family peptidase [Aureitalea marina]|nr:S8 family peptidase [Aureitalea marina]
MKRITTLLLMLICLVASGQELNYMPGEILVQLAPSYSTDQLSLESSEAAIIGQKKVSEVMNIHLITIDRNKLSETEAIAELYKNDQVRIAQLNHKVSLRSVTPDDPLFGNQWQYYQENDRDIDADEAWEISTGGETLNGDIIVAGVVDDGFNVNHPDLNENLFINTKEIPGNGIDDDENGYIDDVNGWNAYNSTGVLQVLSHGTAVYGIIGAKGNNGVGVTGVNWDVKVMPISGSSGNESVVLEAYSYILESRILYNETDGAQGAFVVATNASFGIDFGQPEDSPLWCEMYDTLGQNGILSTGATINGNFDVDEIGDVPTACPSEYLIAVTNTNQSDVKVTQAGYGAETIDLGAPGAGTFTVTTNNYGTFGGTSGATPHVTGTIALLYSAPCQTLADLAMDDPELATRIVRDLVLENVDPNESLEGITTTGGRLNVNNSMVALMDACDTLLGLDDQLPGEDNVLVYPNPARTEITILNPDNRAIERVEIYTLDGKKLETLSLVGERVNVSSLSAGTYVLKIQIAGSSNPIHKMIVKQ